MKKLIKATFATCALTIGMLTMSASPSMANADCGCNIPEYRDATHHAGTNREYSQAYTLVRKCRVTCRANKRHRCIVDRVTTQKDGSKKTHRKKLNCSSGRQADANSVWEEIDTRDDAVAVDELELILDLDTDAVSEVSMSVM